MDGGINIFNEIVFVRTPLQPFSVAKSLSTTNDDCRQRNNGSKTKPCIIIY